MSDALDWMDEEPEAAVDNSAAAAGATQEAGAAATGAEGSQEAPASGAAEASTNDGTEGGAEKDKGEAAAGGATTVPVTALLDEREKRQKAEADLAALRAAQPATEEFVPPDPKEDPEGFANFQRQETAVLVINERLNVSERFAKKEHGAELVKTVKEWAEKKFETDLEFAKKVLTDADPYDVAIAEYQKEQAGEFAGLAPEDVEAIKAARAARAAAGSTGTNQGGSTATATTQPAAGQDAAKPEPVKEALPKSIADETSAGGTHAVVTGPGNAFNDVFAP